MSYRNQDSGTYESKILREIMKIISILIIGICVLVYYINNVLVPSRAVSTDTDTSTVSSSSTSVTKSTEQVNTAKNNVQNDTPSKSEDLVAADRSLDIGKIEQSAHSIEGLTYNAANAVAADIVSYSGSIGADGQEDWYNFTTPYEGLYRVDISGIYNGTAVNLYLYNDLGDVIASDTYCQNEEGFTARGLEAGKTYTIKVAQDTGYTSYSLAIGMQKAPIDLTGYTEINDSVEYIDQKNVYYFSVPITGRYRFDMSEIHSGTSIELYLLDSLGDMVASDTYCTNGEGLTLRDLQAGAVYEIHVEQDNGFSGYKLSIGYQKDTVDITGYTLVNDSIEYTDQRNVYTFTVPIDGRYRFEVSGLSGGASVELYMFNYLDEIVNSDTYCTNGEGITVKGLNAGETYEVQIREDNGFSSYTLSIGKQKETVDISDKMYVSDSVEYTDQRNVYSFTAKSSGDVTVKIAGLESGVNVESCVFDDLENTVVSDTCFTNGESITIKDCTAGEHYEIQIRQDDGLSDYTLEIK